MGRNNKIYIALLVVLLALIIYTDATKPIPIDWSQNYDLNEKAPYGLYVFDQEYQKIIEKDALKKTTVTAYEFLENDYDYDSLVNTYKTKGTVLNIAPENQIDEESAQELLYYVTHGNSVFISANSFPKVLEDSLRFKLEVEYPSPNQLKVFLANPNLGTKKYTLDKGFETTFFSKIDTLNTTLLGYQTSKEGKNVNFIKVAYDKGFFYLHTQPVAFSNYSLLKENRHEYTEKIISYIPKGTIIWLIKGQNGEIKSGSPITYWLSQPALKYGWFLLLIGLVIFMIFNAKRKQRVVPIIKPLPNTTVDFTKTIGNLYYQEGDHQNVIDKKIIYFLEKIRNEYLIETTILDDKFIHKLQLKSGKNIDDIKNVVRLINYQRTTYNQSIEDDLLELNNAIEKILN
jgi:hypothetical protein